MHMSFCHMESCQSLLLVFHFEAVRAALAAMRMRMTMIVVHCCRAVAGQIPLQMPAALAL